MMYLYVILLLVAAEILYLLLAKRYNFTDIKNDEIGDKPRRALKGAGIVFWVAALLYAIFNPGEPSWWFFAGITLVAIVGIWDDTKNAGTWVRLLLHLAAASIAFHLTGVFLEITWWNMVVAYVVFIGIVYAFKFMGGVHGMTGLYSLAVLLPLVYINHYLMPFVQEDFLAYPILAASVLLVFNLGRRSVTGDVGSLAVAFWITTSLVMLIAATGDWVWIGLLMVYGVDTILTLGHRTYLRKPLLKRDELHFYQVIAEKLRIDDRLISIVYMTLQLVISTLLIWSYGNYEKAVFWIALVVLTGIYLVKFRLLRVVKHLER